jgi:hypothetical protein
MCCQCFVVVRTWCTDLYFVSDSNTVYCIIIFANRFECNTFINFLIKYIKCENVLRATGATFLPNDPTHSRRPDLRLQMLHLHFLLSETLPSDSNLLFSASHQLRALAVERDGHWMFVALGAAEVKFATSVRARLGCGDGKSLLYFEGTISESCFFEYRGMQR